MYTGGVTELYFQMYNVSVRCKEGRLLASCHLAHCTVIFFPHINTIAIFCMYVHRYNLTLSSTAWGIKRENILLSNSCPWFPSSTILVILSEIRLIFLQKHIQKCIRWSGNNFCFMIFFVMSLQLCNLPSLTIYSFQKTGFYYKTWAEHSRYLFNTRAQAIKLFFTQMNKWLVRKQFKRCNAHHSIQAQVISKDLGISQRSSTLIAY